jgi:sugar lactone lactonase YvrE
MLDARSLTIVVALLTGSVACAALSNGDALASSRPPASVAMPLPSSSPGAVYVSSLSDGAVYVFSPSGHGQQPIGQIGNLQGPLGLWVDARQNLYVAESRANRVSIYPPGTQQPSAVLKTRQPPAGACGDNDGTTYATNANVGSVEVFAGGAKKPTGILRDEHAVEMAYCRVDPSGDLFVSYFDGRNGGVDEFRAGSTSATPLVCCLASQSPGIELTKHNDLIVQTNSGSCSLSVYHRPYTGAPKKTAACSGSVFQIALDGDQKHLWTADAGNAVADEYSTGSLALRDSTAPINEPVGIAVSPSAGP